MCFSATSELREIRILEPWIVEGDWSCTSNPRLDGLPFNSCILAREIVRIRRHKSFLRNALQQSAIDGWPRFRPDFSS
jgi:hypothetical protein